MRETTRRRHLGVVLAVMALAALAIGCVPETPTQPPTTTCPTTSTPVANLGGGKCNPDPCASTTTAPVANLGGKNCPQPTTPPTTPTLPPQACNAGTRSGGAGVTTTSHSLGVAGPTSFLFTFDAQSQPDRFQVLYDGVEIYESGWRGSSGYVDSNGDPITPVGPGVGSATIAVPAGTATTVTVVVTGSASGTVWSYVVNCPGPPV